MKGESKHTLWFSKDLSISLGECVLNMSDISGAKVRLIFLKELLLYQTTGNIPEYICIMNSYHGICCL